jgi:hypothetical protein
MKVMSVDDSGYKYQCDTVMSDVRLIKLNPYLYDLAASDSLANPTDGGLDRNTV